MQYKHGLGYLSVADQERVQRFLNKCYRMKFSLEPANLVNIASHLDDRYFKKNCQEETHVLHRYLPAKKVSAYDLRTNGHSLQIPRKQTKIYDSGFIMRMLYTN